MAHQKNTQPDKGTSSSESGLSFKVELSPSYGHAAIAEEQRFALLFDLTPFTLIITMAFRCNEFRRHNSEEEGEIGEEEGEIASPSRVPFDEPSANPTTSNTTMSASLTAMLPALSANNNNNNNNSSRSSPQLTTHLQAPQHNINTNIHREPRPPPDRGFRRPPNFAASTAGRGSGWQPRRPWPEHATDPGGIQRASSFTIRNNDSFRAMDPRNNQSTRPTDPRNPGAVEATSLNSQGGPTRPTDPRQISTLTHANVPGDSPHRSEQGTPHFHRSPSFTKPIRQLSVGGGRGHGPPGPSKSLSSGPPIRSASFANRTSHSISHRRESFTQQTRDTSFHRSGGEDPFRRTPEALDPFGRAPRSESSSSDTFGRTTETVDSFGRAPITSIERQHSAEGTFRPRANVDDSIFNRDEPGFNRHRPDNSGFNRPRLERHKSEPDETSFGGRGGGRGGRGNPRRFSSYSSLANDYGGPQRIDVPSHRSFDQSAAARSRLSPPTRISGLESPQKTVFVKQSSELSSDAVPRPPFSEGDPRKKAAEIRGYAPLQVQTMVRQESSGGNQPSAPDMKEGPLSSEQPQPLTLKLQDIQSSQQSSNVAFDRPGIRVSNVTLATPEAPDVCQATPTERRPTPISDSSTWSAPPLQQPFPRRDPRAPENRPKSRNIEPPRPLQLTCSSLGDPEIISRAEGAVKELSALVSSPALVENVGPSYLPTKQSIMKAMIMLDNKIKDCQAIAELADQTLSDAMKVENEEKELHEHQRVKEATSKKNRDGSAFKLDEEIQKRENGISELRSQLQNDIDVRRHALEGEKKEIGEASISCIKQSKSEVRKRKRTELKEQLEIAGQTFESDIEKAHREMQRHVCDAESADNKVAEAAQKYHTKRKESQAQSNHPHLQEEAGMCHLVSQIMKENRKRAAQAQEDSLAFLVVVESECIESVDPKHGKTNAEWTKLTREVTGLVDALYTEPSENPFFDQINDAHEWSGPVVKEYVRDRKRRLNEQWRELAEEYIVRKILYEKNMKKRGAIKGKSGSGAKVRSHRSSILGLDGSIAPSAALSESVDAGDNGGINRSSNNPYRRARRGHAGGAIGDVVRSEYEQEQIIAELTAKEAMEKRIAHGGSKLPRQICTVEKELTATYFNTFTHQRVSDPMEEAYQQSMSNLWTDMEKCIFLDRFMQHPKDFRKIASFLRNKTTSDCISYYYVSKQIVPYKHALKEHLMRRKRRGEYHNWDSTIQASLASGAIVAAGISEEKPLVFHLPWGDNTYHTYKLHPLRRDLLDGVDTSSEHIDEGALECVQAKRRRKQKDPWFILDVEQRKFLRQVEKETISSKTTLIEEQAKIPQTSSGSSVVSEQGGHVERDTPGRKAHKWTADEKRQFFDVIEKHGTQPYLVSN